MSNEFDEIMSKRTNAELIRILESAEGDYQPAALEAAKRVFESRHLSEEQLIVTSKEVEHQQQLDENKANEPLFIGYKIFAFIFPGIILLIFAGTFKADGYYRKAKEMIRWTLYGFGFYIGLLLLAVVLSYFSI